MRHFDADDLTERSTELVVTTPSGFKLRLQPMGWDNNGSQLWRQVGQGLMQ